MRQYSAELLDKVAASLKVDPKSILQSLQLNKKNCLTAQ